MPEPCRPPTADWNHERGGRLVRARAPRDRRGVRRPAGGRCGERFRRYGSRCGRRGRSGSRCGRRGRSG
ncbi:hypothetical protein DJ71_12380, partial [Halorubrum sp. E3]